jgi:hypothetical protein
VVGNDVEHLPQPNFTKASTESLMPFVASQFIIYLLMIDDIVAVHATGSRL